jgi:transcription elongation factor GreA
MVEMKSYQLTIEGKKELEKELKNLLSVKRPDILAQIKAAREQGDLSENADYDSARSEQGRIEGRIKEIQEILDHVEIIKSTKDKKVQIGSKVTIQDLHDKETITYTIVGSIESNPDENLISNDSPLAQAIINKTIGATVEVRGIEKPYKVTIKEIN